jgi:UDP-2,4-diacetamido-2,4,6-trideoxy-beta-L-altropyranose hydrolase
MRVLIRTDASISIGSGHVMRCLTAADKLLKKGHDVVFWMEKLPGNLIDLVQSRGFSVVHEIKEADICIIDHYEIDVKWERSIRLFVKKIVVIDDLANRMHDCDVLLDQNIVPNFETRYNLLVPDHCIKLLGPKYLIVRDEFIKERQQSRARTGDINKLLIFMGGTDPTGETMKVLQVLKGSSKITFDRIDIVVGIGNPDRKKIQDICYREGFHYHCQIDYLASLMAQADFSIGAGGSTMWERCYVGLPSSSTIVANNQILSTKAATKLGIVWNLGWHEKVSMKSYEQLLLSLPGRSVEWKEMSEKGLRMTDNPEGPNSWIEYIEEAIE